LRLKVHRLSRKIYTPSLQATAGLPANFGQQQPCPSRDILFYLQTRVAISVEEPGEKKTAKFEYRSMAQCCISIWAQKNQTKIEITGKRRIYAKILSFQFRKLGHQKRKV
jgi:hypothetical protein